LGCSLAAVEWGAARRPALGRLQPPDSLPRAGCTAPHPPRPRRMEGGARRSGARAARSLPGRVFLITRPATCLNATTCSPRVWQPGALVSRGLRERAARARLAGRLVVLPGRLEPLDALLVLPRLLLLLGGRLLVARALPRVGRLALLLGGLQLPPARLAPHLQQLGLLLRLRARAGPRVCQNPAAPSRRFKGGLRGSAVPRCRAPCSRSPRLPAAAGLARASGSASLCARF